MRDVKTWVQVMFWITLLAFILLTCIGCKQFLVDFAHEVGVAAGVALKEPTAEGKDVYLKAMRKSALVVADKAGMPSKVITPDNVLDRLEETRREAEAYVPWYNHIPSTGMPWLDALIAMLTSGGGLYLLRRPLRRSLHALTHNPKEVGDEKVS